MPLGLYFTAKVYSSTTYLARWKAFDLFRVPFDIVPCRRVSQTHRPFSSFDRDFHYRLVYRADRFSSSTCLIPERALPSNRLKMRYFFFSRIVCQLSFVILTLYFTFFMHTISCKLQLEKASAINAKTRLFIGIRNVLKMIGWYCSCVTRARVLTG